LAVFLILHISPYNSNISAISHKTIRRKK